MTRLDRQLDRQAREAMNELAASELLPRRQRKPSEWAREVRKMPQGGPVSRDQDGIPYDFIHTPHMEEVVDSAADPNIRMVVTWMGVRDGKTAGCLNLMGWIVTDHPGGIFSVHPIDDDVSKFSNDDLEEMIRLSLEDYFVQKKSRDTGRTINYKKYKGGSIRIVNAGSITKFRGSTVRGLFLHEVDGYTEKESIYKAINRTKGLSDAIIYIESTGTNAATVSPDGRIEYHSVIHEFYDKGDKRKWFCRCRECGSLQWLKFGQIQARDGEPRHAKYYCERCDADHNEKQWRRMASSGLWYPTAGLSDDDLLEIETSHQDARAVQPEVRSYWRNGFNSLLPKNRGYATKLHEFLSEGEAAKSSKEALKTWTNEIAAELWSDPEETIEPPAWKPIADGREDYAPENAEPKIPNKALVLTSMTDIHGNRLEVDWRAWAEDEESWGAGHFVLFGDTNKAEVWNEWTQHLGRRFEREDGAPMMLSRAAVDGGWRADPIAATLRRLALVNVPGVSGKIIATKGVAEWQSVIHRRWATISNKLKGIHIGTWCAKSLIYERLRWHSAKERPTAGFIHFGKCYTEDFIKQLVVEKASKELVRGGPRSAPVEVETFKNPEQHRNEGLDLLVGNLAAFRWTRWDFQTIKRDLGSRAEAVKAGAPVPEKKKITLRQVGYMA